MKKGILLLAMLCMGIGIASAALRISSVNEDGITIYYNIDGENAEVTFGDNGKYSGHIRIPQEIEYNLKRYHVNSVGNYAFDKCVGLKSVILPESMESIGYHAFYECGMLAEIRIPDKVSKIGKAAFCNSRLERVNIPQNLKEMEDSTFYGCRLSRIDFPEGLTKIGAYAFAECVNLDYLDLPVSLNNLGDGAFSHCTSLRTASMGMDNDDICGDGIFAYCNNLQKIFYPNDNQWEEFRTLIINGVLKAVAPYGVNRLAIVSHITSVGKYAFTGCHEIESVELPITLLAIEDNAFHDSGIKSINLPDRVETIGEYAFSACINLKDAVLPNSVREIGDNAFLDCPELEQLTIYSPNPATVKTSKNAFPDALRMRLYVPQGSKYLYEGTFPWSQFGKLQEMGVEVCEIPEIYLSDKILKTESATENSSIITAIASKDNAAYQTGNGDFIDLIGQYDISSYAAATGKEHSAAAKATLYLVSVRQDNVGVRQTAQQNNKRAFLIRNDDDRMEISGCREGETVTLTSLSGELLFRGKAGAGNFIMPMDVKKGRIYIVTVGDNSVKYQIR